MPENLTLADAVAFLTQEGNFRVPCSRFGHDSASCAPVAYALAEIIADANGDPIDTEQLDYCMGLVVNDHDDVRSLIVEHGTADQVELIADALTEEAEETGREAGAAAGSWVIDGNTSADTARAILAGYEEGDPEIMDMQPSPLSGEWAGESISELNAQYGLRLDVDTIADAFESAYSEAYWDTVQGAAAACATDGSYVDDFTAAYIECALWSSVHYEDGEDDGQPMDDLYGADDLAPVARAEIERECAEFVEFNANDLALVDADRAGHDFWLTRNGHGAGYWDRGLGDLGNRLTAACRPYGESTLYVGQDGQLYVS